jgi:ATP-dependent Clp protease ATP-binding subunit ClpX
MQGDVNTAVRKNYSAQMILDELGRSVVGQESAKRDLSTLLAMHLLWSESEPPDMLHTAPNALIIGPTGVGKTHAIRMAAETLGAPLAIVDATRLSPHGLDNGLEGVLYELLSASRRLITDPESPQEIRELEELDLMRRGVRVRRSRGGHA